MRATRFTVPQQERDFCMPPNFRPFFALASAVLDLALAELRDPRVATDAARCIFEVPDGWPNIPFWCRVAGIDVQAYRAAARSRLAEAIFAPPPLPRRPTRGPLRLPHGCWDYRIWRTDREARAAFVGRTPHGLPSEARAIAAVLRRMRALPLGRYAIEILLNGEVQYAAPFDNGRAVAA